MLKIKYFTKTILHLTNKHLHELLVQMCANNNFDILNIVVGHLGS